jgi:surface polysaccharide O-acyltransferase-like enzyme
MTKNLKFKERDFALDALKALAIVMVVMIHTSAPGFVTFGEQWHAALFYDSLSRISVPLFFLVTGALLLPRTHSLISIVNRVKLVLIPLLAWSFIYLAWNEFYHGQHTSAWMKTIIQGPVLHMWFVYSLLGAYIFLPLTSGFFRSSSRKERVWILAAAGLGSSIIPLFKDVSGQTLLGIDMNYVPIYSLYMMIGAFVYDEGRAAVSSRRWIFTGLFMWVIGSAATVVGTYSASISTNKYSVVYFNYYSSSVVLAATGCFIFFLGIIKKDFSASWSLPVTYLGRQTLGIYMCHMIPLQLLTEYVSRTGGLSPWLWYPLIVFLTTISSLLLVVLVQQVPYLRKICPV